MTDWIIAAFGVAFSVPPATGDWLGSTTAAIGETIGYVGTAAGLLYLIVRVVLGTQDRALNSNSKRIAELEEDNAKLRGQVAVAASAQLVKEREMNRLQIELDRHTATIEDLKAQVLELSHQLAEVRQQQYREDGS